MKIKVIDLLVKVANGEEIPKKIKFNGNIYEYKWSNAWQESCYINDDKNRLLKDVYLDRDLNEEIKIIEEPKKIEKIDDRYFDETNKCYCGRKELSSSELVDKINELIEEINKLKGND